MKIDDLSKPTFNYYNIENKLSVLSDDTKTLYKLIQTPYDRKRRSFSNRLIDNTRYKLVDDLFTFTEELNRPEFLGNIKLQLKAQKRNWNVWNWQNTSFVSYRNF